MSRLPGVIAIAFLVLVGVVVVTPPAPATPVMREGGTPFVTVVERLTTSPYEAGLSTAIADVTGDGMNDLLLTTLGSPSHLRVYAQQPDHTLDPTPAVYALPPVNEVQPKVNIATGDLDGDHDTDVAVSVSAGADLFFQDAGVLGNEVLVPHAAAGLVVMHDMDRDHDADLVTASGFEGGHVTLMTQGPPGTWTTKVLDTGPYRDIEVADMGGDGRMDVVGTRNEQIRVLRQRGNGTFAIDIYPQGTVMSAVGIGDIDRDGLPDVVANKDFSALRVFPGRADGTLGPSWKTGYAYGEDILVTDQDGNGLLDVLVTTGGDEQIFAFVQRRDGTLDRTCTYQIGDAGGQTGGISSGDLSGDGVAEIAMGDDYFATGPASARILRRTTDGDTEHYTEALPAESPFGVPFDIVGHISPAASCPPVDPRSIYVDVFRSQDGSPPEMLGTARVNQENSFRFTDTPGDLGDYTYTWSWAGDGAHHAIDADPVNTTVVPAPALRLTTPDYVVYGRAGAVQVRLLAHEITSDLTVSLYATQEGSSEELIASGEVDADGVFSKNVSGLTRRTVITARWAGDTNFPAEEVSAEVPVAVSVTGTLLRYQGKDGKFRTYEPGRNVFFRCDVDPSKPDGSVGIRVDRQFGRYWQDWLSQQFALNDQGDVTVYVPGAALDRDLDYRISCSYNGDVTHDGNWSRYHYFRVRGRTRRLPENPRLPVGGLRMTFT
jgi:hypothetical protein